MALMVPGPCDEFWLSRSQTSKVCVAHIFIEGLKGLQVNYCVVQVQDGLKTEMERSQVITASTDHSIQ